MERRHWPSARLAVFATLVIAAGCSKSAETAHTLTLATTTSTQESGLLDELIPVFHKQTGIEVHVVAVGSGQALELGRRGDADVLLTHAPAAEQKFIDEGWTQFRQPLMHNDFVLVGPESDPGKVGSLTSIVEAFDRIAQNAAPFVSRGDDSGTHQKEREIWKKVDRNPEGDWYIPAGTSMAQALRIANEKRAYTLSDRATYITHQSALELVILCQRDPLLRNDYSVLVVSSAKHRHVNEDAAKLFAVFLTSAPTKKLIAQFGARKFGETLFFPSD